MPIYAFTCTACGHEFERLQKLSDADPTDCPACGAAQQVRRRLTAPQFRLAGGGWYETDFKKDGDSRRNLAGDSGAPKESGAGSKEGGSGDSAASGGKAADTKGGDAKPAAGASSGTSESKTTPAKPSAGGSSAGSGSSSGSGGSSGTST